eukprot:scaffold274244_cov23-Tisochrysis_lutea.AAC.1
MLLPPADAGALSDSPELVDHEGAPPPADGDHASAPTDNDTPVSEDAQDGVDAARASLLAGGRRPATSPLESVV